MNNSDRTHYTSNNRWRFLGELELPVGTSAENMIHSWIAEQLAPLDLATGFVNRVVQSAHDATMRYLRPKAELASGHIHLSIHVPGQILTKGGTWGFFHMERIQHKDSSTVAGDHTIEFYLYVEGDEVGA